MITINMLLLAKKINKYKSAIEIIIIIYYFQTNQPIYSTKLRRKELLRPRIQFVLKKII